MGRPRSGKASRTLPTASVGALPGVGEPEGLRRLVERDVLRLGEVGGDHSGAPLLRAGTVRGFGGYAPIRPVLRQRRERPGVRRGRSIPSPAQVCTHWVGWPSCPSTWASPRGWEPSRGLQRAGAPHRESRRVGFESILPSHDLTMSAIRHSSRQGQVSAEWSCPE